MAVVAKVLGLAREIVGGINSGNEEKETDYDFGAAGKGSPVVAKEQGKGGMGNGARRW